MRRQAFIIILLLLSCTQLFADASYNTWWQKANQYYTQQHYDSALIYYNKIAATHPDNAVVYYNLGNTYYRLNQVGPAVLNYERALHYKPNYKEAQDNLILTQNRIPNRIQHTPDIFFIRWWHNITNGHNATAWAIISVVLFLFLLGILITRVLRKDINLPSQLTGTIAVLWVICLSLSFFSANNKASHNVGVVMQNDAPLLNTEGGQTQSLVPEGTTVEFKQRDSGWVEVRLPDGRDGWMQRTLLNKI